MTDPEIDPVGLESLDAAGDQRGAWDRRGIAQRERQAAGRVRDLGLVLQDQNIEVRPASPGRRGRLHSGRDPADDQNSGHAAGLYLPYFAQCGPKIASGVMVRIASGRETQVRLTKCRALTFSVVMLPPQEPQASESV